MKFSVSETNSIFLIFLFHFLIFCLINVLNTCSQNRQSIKFQNYENIIFFEKLYFFILYNQVYIAKHVLKSLHSAFIFREITNHYTVGE